MRRRRLIAAGIWLLVWVAVWVAFVDYLPANVHFEYPGLVSPLLVWQFPMWLLAGEEFSPMAYPELIVPGAVFWLVIGLIAFVPLPSGKK